MKKFLSLAVFSLAILAAPAFAETAAAPTTAAPAAKTAVLPVVPVPAQPSIPVTGPNVVAPTAPMLQKEVMDDDEIKDVLKDIVMHPHPNTFADAQQLALQNRQERIDMLQKSTECVQKAATVEDLYACQADERKSLDKIWLSYCDTTVSFLGARRVGPKKNGNNNQQQGDNPNMQARAKASECDRAMSAVTGRPLAKQQPDQTDQTP